MNIETFEFLRREDALKVIFNDNKYILISLTNKDLIGVNFKNNIFFTKDINCLESLTYDIRLFEDNTELDYKKFDFTSSLVIFYEVLLKTLEDLNYDASFIESEWFTLRKKKLLLKKWFELWVGNEHYVVDFDDLKKLSKGLEIFLRYCLYTRNVRWENFLKNCGKSVVTHTKNNSISMIEYMYIYKNKEVGNHSIYIKKDSEIHFSYVNNNKIFQISYGKVLELEDGKIQVAYTFRKGDNIRVSWFDMSKMFHVIISKKDEDYLSKDESPKFIANIFFDRYINCSDKILKDFKTLNVSKLKKKYAYTILYNLVSVSEILEEDVKERTFNKVKNKVIPYIKDNIDYL